MLSGNQPAFRNNYDYTEDISRYTQQPGAEINDVSRYTRSLSTEDEEEISRYSERSYGPMSRPAVGSRMDRHRTRRKRK